jgi:DNA-binding NarL/FixJ family response regulator
VREHPAILVASADRLFGEAVTAFLVRSLGWRVVGTVGDGLQALALIGRTKPDGVLVIGELPRLGITALARQIRRRSPTIGIVILDGPDSPDALVLGPRAASADVVAGLTAKPDEVPAVGPKANGSFELLARLTRRERLVLKLLAEGLSQADAASRLSLSPHTVRTHTQNLYAKLGLHSRLDLVGFAYRCGLIQTAEPSDPQAGS